MSFHDTELRVIRDAEARNALNDNEEVQALYVASDVGMLCDAIATGRPVDHISDAMGRVAIDMIVLCAILDIDLAKSLETAFNKISAKPTAQVLAAQERADTASNKWNDGVSATDYTPVDTSNVVLLKRDQS